MIYVDEDAAKFVADKLSKTGSRALRLEVKGSGCTGYKHVFSLAEEVTDGDHVVCSGGARLVVDPVSMKLLQGSSLALEKTPFKTQLRVLNPNIKTVCGCGESFSV